MATSDTANPAEAGDADPSQGATPATDAARARSRWPTALLVAATAVAVGATIYFYKTQLMQAGSSYLAAHPIDVGAAAAAGASKLSASSEAWTAFGLWAGIYTVVWRLFKPTEKKPSWIEALGVGAAASWLAELLGSRSTFSLWAGLALLGWRAALYLKNPPDWMKAAYDQRAYDASREGRRGRSFLLGDDPQALPPLRRLMHEASVLYRKDGSIGVALLCCLLVSIASWYTTVVGAVTFFGLEPHQILFAALLGTGIQGVLYLASRFVAIESVAYSRAMQLAKEKRRQTRVSLWERLTTGRSAADGPPPELFGFTRRNAGIVSMFLVCFSASAFFSFASHFHNVYGPERLKLANEQNARADTEKVLVSAQNEIVAERDKVSATLRASDEWRAFAGKLGELLRFAEQRPDQIRAQLKAKRDVVERDRAGANERLLAARAAKARAERDKELVDRKIAAAPAADPVDNRNLGEVADVPALERQVADLRVALKNEGKKSSGNLLENIPRACRDKAKINPTTGRTPGGPGPVTRCLNEALQDLQTKLADARGIAKSRANQRDQVAGDVAAARQRSKDLQADIDRLAGDIIVAQREVDEAQRQLAGIDGSKDQAIVNVTGDGGILKSIAGARDTFTASGDRGQFNQMVGQCRTLLETLQQSKDPGLPAGACDTSAISDKVDRLATLNEALKAYRERCAIDEGFIKLKTPSEFVDRGKTCLALAQVPARTTKESAVMDSIAQLNDPNASNFERAVSSLRRGDILAWLSFALALGVDYLVYLGAKAAANADSSVLVRRGVFSTTEEQADVFTEDVKLQVYKDDPPNVACAKHILANVETRVEVDAKGKAMEPAHYLSLDDVRPEARAEVRNFLNRSVGAKLASTRDGRVFDLTHNLYLHLNRLVGDFEREQTLRKKERPANSGTDPASGASNDNPKGASAGFARGAASGFSGGPGATRDYPPPHGGEAAQEQPSAKPADDDEDDGFDHRTWR